MKSDGVADDNSSFYDFSSLFKATPWNPRNNTSGLVNTQPGIGSAKCTLPIQKEHWIWKTAWKGQWFNYVIVHQCFTRSAYDNDGFKLCKKLSGILIPKSLICKYNQFTSMRIFVVCHVYCSSVTNCLRDPNVIYLGHENLCSKSYLQYFGGKGLVIKITWLCLTWLWILKSCQR